MRIDELLAEITASTRLLMQQSLRSKAAVLAELAPLTEEASSRGVTYHAIHAAMVDGGFDITFGYYETARLRVRARVTQKGKLHGTVASATDRSGSQEPKTVVEAEPMRNGSQEPTNTSGESGIKPGDAFGVREALKQAQATSRIDYRKHAKGKP